MKSPLSVATAIDAEYCLQQVDLELREVIGVFTTAAASVVRLSGQW